MSHTNCIARALLETPMDNVAVVNMLRKETSSKDFEWPLVPEIVCLSIAGNAHNILTLFEHPVPFSSGGMKLDGKSRVSIPTSLIKDVMSNKLEKFDRVVENLHRRFSHARIVHLCAPPPIGDTEKVGYTPEMFREVSKLGYAPNALRKMVYDIQVEYCQALANRAGAYFMTPPAEALDSDGLLASRYSGVDPTHANRLYGKLVLDSIIEWGERQND